ncbi:MAG TPA: OB-fold domain-containing protein [Jatrophihabitans sp.]|nr:OB-fold domain-containing protein [Jatrophihabitans sp.]
MTASAAPARRGPTPDEDSEPYWRALAEHRLICQLCLTCGEQRTPPMPSCPNCGSTAAQWQDCSGHGRVYSWILVRVPVGNLTADDVPCVIATIELAGGARLVGRILDRAEVDIDLAVRPHFIDHGEWTELAFVAAEAGPR